MWVNIAGRFTHETVGEAGKMLTTEPGPDIAPYHNRQIVLPCPEQWRGWIGVDRGPMPPGSLDVEQVR